MEIYRALIIHQTKFLNFSNMEMLNIEISEEITIKPFQI